MYFALLLVPLVAYFLFPNSPSMSISAVRVPATKTARSAIIFVHGLGDSGEGWSWFPQVIAQTGLLKCQAETNFVFPNAPTIPITANGGMSMPGWFNIYEFGSPNARQDVDGFLKSCEIVKQLVKEQIEKYNVPAERIVLGGFSQGSAISMAVLALLDVKIGGLVAISGFSPVSDAIRANYNKNGVNFDTPVFQGHGDIDPIISHSFGENACQFYKSLGFKDWTFKTYEGVPHSTNNQELIDIIRFLSLVLDK